MQKRYRQGVGQYVLFQPRIGSQLAELKMWLVALVPNDWRKWLTVAGFSISFIALDYVTGPHIRFPISIAIPVIYAAWHLGWLPGPAFAALLPAVRLILLPDVTGEHFTPTDFINMAIRIVVLSTLAWLTSSAAKQATQIETLNKKLNQRVKTLEGILTICCFCKKIKETEGQWKQLETYISDHADVMFSHGYCEKCVREQFPQMFDDKPNAA